VRRGWVAIARASVLLFAISLTVSNLAVAATAATIVGFSPSSGFPGASVFISGTGLLAPAPATAVKFNGTSAPFVVLSDSFLRATVPAGATTGPIEVDAPSGNITTPGSFTVLACTPGVPTITSFSPVSEAIGSNVDIFGTNLCAATTVRFNGVSAVFSVFTDTEIGATVPAGATSGPISVTTSLGTAVSAGSFTVLAPTISSFSPTSGPVGMAVTITGTNLTGATVVRFNGVPATFTVRSPAQLVASVPAGASSGLISVTTPGGTATTPTSFTVGGAGALDPSFGIGGKVTTDLGADDEIIGLTIQPDGKIVGVGETFNGATGKSKFAVVRYNSDGSLDPSFGAGGAVTTDFAGRNAIAEAVAIQPDGKIVVGGHAQIGTDESTSDFALARYNRDGSIDQTFGVQGEVLTDFGGKFDSVSAGVVVQSDGKIVAGGDANDDFVALQSDFALVRYTTNGNLDPTFGTGGKVASDIENHDSGASGLVLQPDGRIVLGGNANGKWTLARYTASGALDASFGTGGVAENDLGPVGVEGLALQPDGKFVAAGRATLPGFASDFAVERANADGSLDPGFGSGGKVITHLGSGEAFAVAVVIQSDGKIVAAGNFFGNFGGGFALVRYNPDGSLDTGFGAGGTVFTTFGGDGDLVAAAIQPDGKIVAGGIGPGGVGEDMVLARYLPQATPTSSCTITGTAGNDILTGTSGADVICGLGGSDAIRGLEGNDTLIGASGNDVLLGGAGADTVMGGKGDDTLTGGAGADVLEGGGGNDSIEGDGGPDILRGQDGDDTLEATDGISGNDGLWGGAGTDSCTGDPGDRVTGCP
jgi:uncharacterized delta-60 repeat protein